MFRKPNTAACREKENPRWVKRGWEKEEVGIVGQPSSATERKAACGSVRLSGSLREGSHARGWCRPSP